MTTPLSGANSLRTNYGSADGGSPGDHLTTIPFNFGLIRDAVQGLHARLSSLEGATNERVAQARYSAEVNGFFQMRRKIPRYLSTIPTVGTGSPVVVALQPAAPSNLFTSPYTGGRVNPLAGGSGYVQSIWPGWMQRIDSFSGLGSEFLGGTNTRAGARLLIRTNNAHNNAALATLNTGAGYIPSATSPDDISAFYQVLHRHFPIELMRGKSIYFRVSYFHSAAMPAGLTVVPYVSYVNGGFRYDWAGTPIGQTTTDAGAVFVDSAAIPGFGVIPSTATGVEVGLMITSPVTGLPAGTDALDLVSATVDIGGIRTELTPVSFGETAAAAGTYYVQEVSRVRVGQRFPFSTINLTPYQTWIGSAAIIDPAAGAWTNPTNPGGATPTLSEDFPLSLPTPWLRALNGVTSLIPGCRAYEVVAAAALEAVASTWGVGTAETIAMTSAFLEPVVTGDFGDQVGLAQALQLNFLVTMLNINSRVLQGGTMLPVDVNLEIQSGLAPLLA